MIKRRRALAASAAGALVAPFLALATGTAFAVVPGDAIPPEQQAVDALCVNVLQTEPFTDIEGSTFERAIECLAATGVAQGGANGSSASLFSPGVNVKRDSMATFVARLIDTAGTLSGGSMRVLPGYDGTPAFTDVPDTDIHHTAINRLEQAGIVEGGVAGGPATAYSPKIAVSRAQMASFLNRAYDFLAGGPLRTENDYFTDDEISLHEANINGIASEGIAVGVGGAAYRPDSDVLRGQMAGFLTRLLAVLEEQGRLTPVPPDSAALRAAVDVDAVEAHLQALQDIADDNDGIRASGTQGYDESAEYVADQLTEAGYDVDVQEFEFPFFQELEDSRVVPAGATESIETGAFTFSGSGDVQDAEVVDVDFTEPSGPDNSSTSGCEPEDFEAFPAGAVALVQRGACTFGLKATNAEEAGASAVIIANEGQEGRQELIVGTLGEPGYGIPVVGASFEDGRTVAEAGTVDVFASTESETRTTTNVLAESATGDDSNVVMMGAHLDSVTEGPGIQDNGTGSAALIEVAKQAAEIKPTNKLRFAWWGAEELGLLGAENYVADLSEEEVDDIALYLNYDMIGSPNFMRGVYDGDGSATADEDGDGVGDGAGPQGSAAIEYMFADYFESQDLASNATDFSGRSDYGPFIAEGIDIPAGGLFTGAEGLKSEAQAEVYGGEAGVAYDSCYHEACDRIDNVNLEVLEQNVGAVVHGLVVFGASTVGAYDLSQDNRESGPGTSPESGEDQGGLHDHTEDVE